MPLRLCRLCVFLVEWVCVCVCVSMSVCVQHNFLYRQAHTYTHSAQGRALSSVVVGKQNVKKSNSLHKRNKTRREQTKRDETQRDASPNEQDETQHCNVPG